LPPELLLLAQICTKSFVGWGFTPDPTGGPPDPLVGLGGGAPGEREGGMGGEKERGEGRQWSGGKGGSPGMPKSRVGKPIYGYGCSKGKVHHTPLGESR